MDRKKELKAKYKQLKPEMGVFVLRNCKTQKCFIEASADIKSMMSRIRFELSMGNYPHQEIQHDWKAQGETVFAFEVIDKLAYSKDASKTDYAEDLKTLKNIWIEKLSVDEKTDWY